MNLLPLALLLAAAAPGQDAPPVRDDEWLILQTAADPMALVGAAAAKRAPGARVIATGECDGMRPVSYTHLTLPTNREV